MDKAEILSMLPAVDQLLHDSELAPLRDEHPHRSLVAWIRAAMDQVRRELLEGRTMRPEELRQAIVDAVLKSVQADAGRIVRPVINATGIILHTNLGRAPLGTSVVQRMTRASSYTNLELDLKTGKRSTRGGRVLELLADLTGAEAAIVVNNCAGATLLVLQATAMGREVVISRGQLVEIGGGFRLPDVFRAAGVVLREVGTTNRTYLRDYENAISEATGAVIRVHRSNFSQQGFVTEPSIAEMIPLSSKQHFPIIDDVGSGSLYDLSKFGLNEPCVLDSVQAGADLCLFSGDKLFGGPQCGIIVGKKKWIGQLKTSPMMRALRVDKVTLAALEVTTEIHLMERAFEQLPALQMLSTNVRSIQSVAERILQGLPLELQEHVCVVSCESQLGGGTLPGQTLASYGLAVAGEHLDRLARALRVGHPAIQGRLCEGRLLFDMRTVDSQQQDAFARRFSQALKEWVGGMS